MFAGIHAVLFALFRKDERIDHGAMARQVDYCVERGCHGVTVLGLATEVQKLSFAERIALIETTAEALAGRRTLSVTIVGNSVAEQVELIRAAEINGADWLILQPPMAGTFGADTYLDFFERVAGATELPFAVQNAPAYLGRALAAADIGRLRQRCPHFKAVKSEDALLGVRAMIDTAGDGLAVLGGRGGLELIDMLRIGCGGFVLAPDIAPVAVRLRAMWQAGEVERAEELYAAAAPAIVFAMQSLEHLHTYGKRIFADQCGLPVHDRAPFLTATALGLEIARRHAAALKRLAA